MSHSRIGHYRGAVPGVPGCASGGILPGKYQTLNLRYLTEARQGLCTGLGPYSPATGYRHVCCSVTRNLTSQFQSSCCCSGTGLQSRAQFRLLRDVRNHRAHGCAIKPLPSNPGLRFIFRPNKGVTPRPTWSIAPLNSGQRGSKVAAKLDQPQNLWGLEGCPDDWKRWLVTEIFSDQSPRADLRVSNLNSLVTQLLEPLQTEVMELREKLAQGTARRSGSLTSP